MRSGNEKSKQIVRLMRSFSFYFRKERKVEVTNTEFVCVFKRGVVCALRAFTGKLEN